MQGEELSWKSIPRVVMILLILNIIVFVFDVSPVKGRPCQGRIRYHETIRSIYN